MGACSSLVKKVKESAPELQKAKGLYDDHKLDQELNEMVEELETKGEPNRLEESIKNATDVNSILTQQSLLKSYYDPLIRRYDPKHPNDRVNQAISKYGGLLSRCDQALSLARENQEIQQQRVNIESLGRLDWLKEGVAKNEVTYSMYELMNRYYEPFFLRFSASTNSNAKKLIDEVQPLMKSAQDRLHAQGIDTTEVNRGMGMGMGMTGGLPLRAGPNGVKGRANSLPSATVVGMDQHSNEIEG
jgi:hypothetical protein